MTLLTLCWSFFQVGLFSIGGGYAAMPFIQAQTVTLHRWLTMGEFSDLVTIAEMTPGPIALNAATFVGTRVAGAPGALVATLGCILPSCLIVSALAWVYRRYRKLTVMQSVLKSLRPVVVALIASAGLGILKTATLGGGALRPGNVNWPNAALFVAALVALRKLKWNPIRTMLACGALYVLLSLALGPFPAG